MAQIIPIPCGFVNCYLVKNGGRAILIDAAFAGSEGRITAALKAHGTDPRGLGLLLLTHGHADHVGGVAALRERYGVKVAIHPEDETVTEKLRGDSLFARLTLPFMNAAKPVTVKADIPLAEDVNLGAYGIPAKLLELPGHTDGSVALLFDDGRLIAGDTFFGGGSPSFAHIAVDFDALRRNRARLDALGVTTVYPGHGKPFAYSEVK